MSYVPYMIYDIKLDEGEDADSWVAQYLPGIFYWPVERGLSISLLILKTVGPGRCRSCVRA